MNKKPTQKEWENYLWWRENICNRIRILIRLRYTEIGKKLLKKSITELRNHKFYGKRI